MVKRVEIITEARTWLGTRYRHQGRLKGVSVDCVGLVLGVAQALGVPCYDVEGYSRRPDGSLQPNVDLQTNPVVGVGQPGDIVVFHWGGEPMHLAILTGLDTVIHAFAVNRMVCEHSLDDKLRRFIKTYRAFPGVED